MTKLRSEKTKQNKKDGVGLGGPGQLVQVETYRIKEVKGCWRHVLNIHFKRETRAQCSLPDQGNCNFRMQNDRKNKAPGNITLKSRHLGKAGQEEAISCRLLALTHFPLAAAS